MATHQVEYKMGGDSKPLSNRRPTVEYLIDKMVNTLDASEVTITFKPIYRVNNTNLEIINFMRKYFRFLPLNLLRKLY